jgi:sensor domain CHASE-containing protein
MTESQTIALLVTAVAGLVTAVVYLYKRGEKREKEMQALVKDALNTIKNNEAVGEVLKRVEKLLNNWRGH